jgi:hypothetical protein
MRMNYKSLKVTQYVYIQGLAESHLRDIQFTQNVNRLDELQRLTEAAAYD